jgi:hypothetical protein
MKEESKFGAEERVVVELCKLPGVEIGSKDGEVEDI